MQRKSNQIPCPKDIADYSRVNKGRTLNAVEPDCCSCGTVLNIKHTPVVTDPTTSYYTQYAFAINVEMTCALCVFHVECEHCINIRSSVELQHPILFPCPCHGGVATSRGRYSLSVTVRRSAQGVGEEWRVLRASMRLLSRKSAMLNTAGRVCSFHLDNGCFPSQNITYLGGGFKYFLFSPLGKWSNLTSIFFRWVGSTTN